MYAGVGWNVEKWKMVSRALETEIELMVVREWEGDRINQKGNLKNEYQRASRRRRNEHKRRKYIQTGLAYSLV